MFQVCVNDITNVHSILVCFTTLVTGNYGKELIVMPKELFENYSKHLINNTKDTVDDTLATDDDKQLKAQNIIYKYIYISLYSNTIL
jgi:hypothetical protein